MRALSETFHAVPPREQIDKWVDLAAGPKALVAALGLDLVLLQSKKRQATLAKFNDKLKLATLYNSNDSQSSNHSKVYIIDDDCFYVGSDNMYPSAHKEGLQEFGYLIEDKKETQKFITEYWEKLWQYSKTKGALN